MKIREIISETTELSDYKITQKIKDECRPYLNIVGDYSDRYALYRGVEGDLPKFSYQRNPINRKPTDTPKVIHDLFDNWFLEHFRTAYRSNATFANGNAGTVQDNYGMVYELFPIGHFKFCWSPNIKDLTYDLVGNRMNEIWRQPPGSDRDVQMKELCDAIIASAGYQTTGLTYAIESNNEIMIHAPLGCYKL